MAAPSTGDLMKSLESCEDPKAFQSENSEFLIEEPLCQALSALLEEKGLSRSQVIRSASLNTIYGHQIFSGARTPSRDKLLAIAFGMSLSLEETNTLMKRQGYPMLYPRHRRDAVIIYSLLHGLSLLDANTLLYESELETLI